MKFHLLFIHLFKPFLKYTQQTSPLPQNVSPRKLCTQAAGMISKLMRLYKRSHGLRQICNIAVYIVHSACTIHLLNLPEKNARRDIVHGVKHLEEIAEGWLCARRTLGILSVLAKRWKVALPEEASVVLARTDAKFGSYTGEASSPRAVARPSEQVMNPSQLAVQATWQNQAAIPTTGGYFNDASLPAPTAGGAPPPSSAAAPVRSHSGNRSLPPDNAEGLLAKQYPSAAATPASSQRHNRGRESLGTSAASPSDMFGGVEQLIRDSQDWVYRDQAQFATGFDNWTGMDMDASSWGNGMGVGSGGVSGGVGAVNASMSSGFSMPATSAPATTTTPAPAN